MTADASRRPRSPRSQDKGSGSPAVSELSTDGSGTLRSVDDTSPSPPRGRARGGGDESSGTPAPGKAPKTTTEVGADDDADSGARYQHERAGEESDVASSSSLSATSSVAHSHSDFDSDADDSRSDSETYWGDLGGEVERDEIGWTQVIKQNDIQRTYDSDTDDVDEQDFGVDVEDLDVVVGVSKTKESRETDSGADLDKELDELELLEDDDDAKDALSIDSVKILDDVHAPTRSPSSRSVQSLQNSISDSSIRAPPSEVSLDDDVDAVAVALSDGDDVLPDDESVYSSAGGSTDRRSVGFVLPAPQRSGDISSAESDDAVAVALSDGEEVLSDDDSEVRGPAELAAAVERERERRRVVDVGSAASASASGSVPRRTRARTSTGCVRRTELHTRLTAIRAGLQMVQMELATRSATNQLECGRRNKHETSELKMRLRKERVTLSATLNNLAKMSLERAIDLEAKLERERDTNSKPCGIL